jgi:hypothetical protein
MTETAKMLIWTAQMSGWPPIVSTLSTMCLGLTDCLLWICDAAYLIIADFEPMFCVPRASLVDSAFWPLSPRKKSRHAGQNAFCSIAAPHRPHGSRVTLEACISMPYFLTLITADLLLAEGKISNVLRPAAAKVAELALLSSLR